ITFDVGGVKEAVIHKQNGYVAKYRNLDDLEQGLKWFLQLSAEDCELIKESSVYRVQKNFSSRQMIDNYFKLYKEISN
ncbi:MAG: glycosyl transferase, partial [Candidatus Vogelbacteria bacterium]|nr:glycosyl transferase [Candidatus Vogelbacteria bacterium]